MTMLAKVMEIDLRDEKPERLTRGAYYNDRERQGGREHFRLDHLNIKRLPRAY